MEQARELIIKSFKKRLAHHNLPDNMTMGDFNEWSELNRVILQKEQLGWSCETWKNQRFDIINKYQV